jgi:hypothetical protein
MHERSTILTIRSLTSTAGLVRPSHRPGFLVPRAIPQHDASMRVSGVPVVGEGRSADAHAGREASKHMDE